MIMINMCLNNRHNGPIVTSKAKSKSHSRAMSIQLNITIAAIVVGLACLGQRQTSAAPSDIQPANQAPNMPTSLSSISNEPSSSSSVASTSLHSNLAQQQQQQQPQVVALPPVPRLPKINFYISNSQVFKLLGIDKRIYYVTNGNIDAYPLSFTIPLGFNQSDMIFTWQNLGQQTVNYSISLIIGNIHAVDSPIINITRSGSIPTYEQVFKITLPCSGKVTDEVDVQVLINITGFVSAGDDDNSQAQLLEPTAAANQEALSLGQNASDSQQQLMQADEAPAGGEKLRFVSHKLAIKRKKICTMHPVPVQPAPGARPGTQAPQINLRPHQVALENRWRPSTVQAPNQAQTEQPPTKEKVFQTNSTGPANSNLNSFGNQPEQTNIQQQPQPQPLDQVSTNSLAEDSLELTTRKLKDLNLIPNSNQEARATNYFYAGDRTRPTPPISGLPDLSHYPGWNQRLKQQQLPTQPSIELGSNDILRAATLAGGQQQQVSAAQANSAGNSPLVFTLIALSLLISIALIVVAILGSSSSTHAMKRRSPIDKLTRFTSQFFRPTPGRIVTNGGAGANHQNVIISNAHNNKCKSPIASGLIINSLRAATNVAPVAHNGSKSSSVSGLSAISGQSKSQQYGGNCYYTNNQHQQQQYQQPASVRQQQQQPKQQAGYMPTADLLGTGYQCQQQQANILHQQTLSPSQYPIYHIAANNTAQVTRLIWNNGNGTSPDGFTIDGGSYTPWLSSGFNAPRSDHSGSVYQTIY